MKKTTQAIYVLMVTAFLGCLLSDDTFKKMPDNARVFIGDMSRVINAPSHIITDKKIKLVIPSRGMFLYNSTAGSKINHFNCGGAGALVALIKAKH